MSFKIFVAFICVFVCVCSYACVPQCACGGRRTACQGGSLLPLCGPGGGTQVVRLGKVSAFSK